jgi:hypothetical protein
LPICIPKEDAPLALPVKEGPVTNVGKKRHLRTYQNTSINDRPRLGHLARKLRSPAIEQFRVLWRFQPGATPRCATRPIKLCACFCSQTARMSRRAPRALPRTLPESIDWRLPVFYLSASCCNPHSRLLDWRPDAILFVPGYWKQGLEVHRGPKTRSHFPESEKRFAARWFFEKTREPLPIPQWDGQTLTS